MFTAVILADAAAISVRLPDNTNVTDARTVEEVLGLFPPGTHLDDDGTLVVGGCRLDELADRFGTPAIIVAEDALRQRAADYLTAFRHRWPRSEAATHQMEFCLVPL